MKQDKGIIRLVQNGAISIRRNNKRQKIAQVNDRQNKLSLTVAHEKITP